MITTNNSMDSTALLLRLWRDYISRFKLKIVIAAILMILVAATTAANAYLMQPMLDEIFLNKNREMLVVIPFAVLAIFAVKAASSYGQSVILATLGQRIVATMQQQLYRHLIYADIGLFADKASGRLISRFTNDIYLLRNAVSTIFTGFIKEALTLVFLIGVMFYQSWLLALVALIIFPLSAWPVIRLGKRMRKLSNQTQEGISDFAGQLDETFAGVRVVKAYGQEEKEVQRASDHIESLYNLYKKTAKIQAIASPMMEMFTGCAIAAVIWYGGMQVMNGVTSAGAFFSFITAMIMAYKPAKTMANFSTNLQEGLAAAARLFAVLDTKPNINDKPNATPLKVSSGNIVIDNLTFNYQGGAGIERISLQVPAGRTVALVGPSGGGKSTLMNLLLRFYAPQEGAIYIDNQDIADVTLSSLRNSISLVSQETVLFDDTVANNIAYGRPEATADEIEQAARAAAAHDFITDLEYGYDTIVGARGIKLSGGQRQRIAIARALLKNAPILLLDEATSALDTQSEQQVQQALDRLMHGRTTLVIAHRLSTIRHAAVIYVLDKGKVVESGTHQELLNKGGLFKRLYAIQADAVG